MTNRLPARTLVGTASDNWLLDRARRVLTEEADALAVLRDTLDGGFAAAARLLAAVRQRIVVTGVGKSGHVGRKIAATFSSVGLPAFFMHPAEASHGDLGAITGEDALLALSKSGESRELADIIVYARRQALPVVAITAGRASTLGRRADVCLCLPALSEADGIDLAPTTSTTLMMALGDALAVTVMGLKGTTPEDFRRWHPGGRLGVSLLKVGDLMRSGDAVPLVRPDTPMREVLAEISAKGLGCALLCDGEGRLAGIVTDGDLRRHADGLLERRVAEIATTAPQTGAPDWRASQALSLMYRRKISALPILEADVLVGLLHLHDCLRAGVAEE